MSANRVLRAGTKAAAARCDGGWSWLVVFMRFPLQHQKRDHLRARVASRAVCGRIEGL